MKTVLINKDGYLRSMYFPEANISIEISDEDYNKICCGKLNFNWRYINNEFVLEPLMTDKCLKDRRQIECFSIIDNRSPMWYNNLSQEHKDELNSWYQAWLDVTKTKVIPTKPEWL